MEYKVIFLLGLLATVSCLEGTIDGDVQAPVQAPVVPVAEAVDEPTRIVPSSPVPVVPEPEFIKLYIQENAVGVYRTEKGEYVRIFKVLNPPADLAGFPEAPVLPPVLQRLTPLPPAVPIPRQRSAAIVNPNLAARSGKTGLAASGTARYSIYDNFGSYDPYYYTPGYYGGGFGNAYPYSNYYGNYPYYY